MFLISAGEAEKAAGRRFHSDGLSPAVQGGVELVGDVLVIEREGVWTMSKPTTTRISHTPGERSRIDPVPLRARDHAPSSL